MADFFVLVSDWFGRDENLFSESGFSRGAKLAAPGYKQAAGRLQSGRFARGRFYAQLGKSSAVQVG